MVLSPFLQNLSALKLILASIIKINVIYLAHKK